MHFGPPMHPRIKQSLFSILFLTFLISRTPGQAQGTAFTYQGRLNTVAGLADGFYDLRFSLWNADSNGNMLGNATTNTGIRISGGVFTVILDFGDFFDGSGRWVEISVRTNGSGAFTELSPRQRFSAVPYAIYAGAVNAAGINGTISAANFGAGTITSNMLAAGAAGGNLAASGQSVIPSGTVVFSSDENDTNLALAGYLRSGGVVPTQNLWQQRTASPLPARGGHAAVWTGNKMLVWGGNCGNDNSNIPPPKIRFTDGGCYDPASNSWSVITTNGAPPAREQFKSVWTGAELI